MSIKSTIVKTVGRLESYVGVASKLRISPLVGFRVTLPEFFTFLKKDFPSVKRRTWLLFMYPLFFEYLHNAKIITNPLAFADRSRLHRRPAKIGKFHPLASLSDVLGYRSVHTENKMH